MNAIAAALDQFEIGMPIVAANLTMFPLLLPARFLAVLKRTAAERFPAIGLGEDVRVEGRFVAGGGLMVDGTLIHLVAFPATKPGRRTTREPIEEEVF